MHQNSLFHTTKDSMKHFLGLQLWHLLKYAELTEAVRQNGKLLVEFLNKVRVGNIDDDVKTYSRQDLYVNLMKTIQKIPRTRTQRMQMNYAVLHNLPLELYIIEAYDKIPDNCKHPVTKI